MEEKLDIFLLDNSNNIIKEFNIEKPITYQELRMKLENNLKNNIDNFKIFYQSSNNQEIEIHNNEEYQLTKDILFIREKDKINLYKSIFEINYDKSSESIKDKLDQKYACLICSEIIKNEKPFFCYTCQKNYHHICLENWDKKKGENKILQCPNCRKELPLKEWKEKLDFEDNRKNDGYTLKYINELKNNIANQGEIIKKFNKLIESILNKIIEINLLTKMNINKNLINLIKEFSENNNAIIIDDITISLIKELEEIKLYIKDEENNENMNLSNHKENNKKNEIKEFLKIINDDYNIENFNNFKNEEIDIRINENPNEINLIYITEFEGINNIFGKKFVETNKDNIDLIINGEKKNLIEVYNLKKGENNIKIILKNKINYLAYMFEGCNSLKNIDELKKIDTKEIEDFSHIFHGCSLISDIKSLKNWDTSKGIDFSFIFYGCSSLTDIYPLSNWNFSNCRNIQSFFYKCSSLSDIRPIQNWNVSLCNNFQYIFSYCSSLSDISPLYNWNVSNGRYFQSMFYECQLITSIKPLENWNVSKGNDFSFMFDGCLSLKNITSLHNWDVSNSSSFQYFFSGCSLLKDINSLENWNVSNCNNFSSMFYKYHSLSNIKSLQK